MCFHIRWSDNNKLDWECHKSPEDATYRALELMSPQDNFTIEACGPQTDTPCPLSPNKEDAS
jgi:hypothetical protein